MVSGVPNLQVRHFPGRDGTELAWREVGDGRPLVLLHGLLGSGSELIRLGPPLALAELGYRVILPDLRGHGDSGRPHDPVSYPPDVLADDGLALIDHLRLDDYDLAGYSLGGRLVDTFVATPEETLRQVPTPTLILVGDHVTALGAPEFTATLATFLKS
jgi:pimeloyl-ACP methyl ester carboxylesterase